MMSTLARNWWLVLLRGLCAILFGILAFTWPGLTLLTLALMWGIYAIADGITALTLAVAGRRIGPPAWWLILTGVLGILAGIIAIVHPGLAITVLLLFIGFWAIARGIMEIVAAIALRREVANEFLLLLSGLISILFGILLVARPGTGALALVWLVGTLAIVYGVFEIGLAFRLRQLKGRLEPPPAAAAPPAAPGIV
ncbi:MAG TPA: HdeD family acid-resistance protein [Tepidisphaeraceae bacterium]